jgi:two-component system response regulator HydG
MSTSATSTLLLVDDEEETRTMLRQMLEWQGYHAVAVGSGSEALEYLRSAIADVVITDVRMPGMSGIELCRELTLRHPDLVTIVLTGVADMERAIEAIRAGAYDFMAKPVKIDALEIAIKRALEHLAMRREVRRLRLTAPVTINGITGTSAPTRAMLDLVRRAATSDPTVLVTGESGTGKELVARALHNGSPRASEPFVSVNCGAIPGPLLESELFGHVRGAFTDARRTRAGLFLQAGGGTLLLDEIGEMLLEMQVKLLRALQERKVRPVGGDDELPFSCRIVAATNRDLEREVEAKRFREDLFYRINVLVIGVPPLRERRDDILELARLFLARAVERYALKPLALSPEVEDRLLAYDWPGNVRELENSIERAVAIARGPLIEVGALPAKIATFEPSQIVIGGDLPEELITLDELNRRYVRRVLAAARGNKTLAARLLGIDRRSLYRRLESLERNGNSEDPRA